MTEQATPSVEVKPARNYDYTRNKRVSKNALPDTPAHCTNSKTCSYLSQDAHRHGNCNNPRANKKNKDAACHKIAPKALLEKLTIIPITAE